jgi:probable O-glycosylation ligase (exosortase A-associated)
MNKINNYSNAILYGVMVMLLVLVARIQELFVFLVPLRLGMISVILTLFLLFFYKKQINFLNIINISQVRIAIAILVMAIISVPFSVWPGQSFNQVESFTLTILFFISTIYSVNIFSDIKKLLWVFVVGVLFLAVFTITSNSGDRLTASATYDPNDIAMIFVVTIPIVYFLIYRSTGLAKLFLFASMIAMVIANILTVSRVGFGGLVVVGFLIFMLDTYRRRKTKVMVGLAIIFLFVQLAPESYWVRMQTLLTYEEDYNMTSDFGRKNLWISGMKLMIDNPFAGVGIGAFTTAMGYTYGQNVSGFKWSAAHNAFVQIGAELGVVGFILFIILILSSIIYLRRLRVGYIRHDGVYNDRLWLVSAIEISLWGYAVTAMFISVAYYPILYFLIALCCSLKKIEIQDYSSYLFAESHYSQEN